jgi:hypothetical protein
MRLMLLIDRFRPLASVSHHKNFHRQVWAVGLVGRYVPGCLDRLIEFLVS